MIAWWLMGCQRGRSNFLGLFVKAILPVQTERITVYNKLEKDQQEFFAFEKECV